MDEGMEFVYPMTDPNSEFLQNLWKDYPELYMLPEIWKPITDKSVPGVRLNVYFVSMYGRIYSTIRNTFLTPVETENGYFRVFLANEDGSKGRYHLLHRIVMCEFYQISDSDLYQVNHKDGIKSHNWYWNLEWVTCSENRAHAINMGLVKINGEEHPMHIISNDIADKIGFLLSTTDMAAKEIASYVGGGATERIVFNISSGTAWPNVYTKYNLSAFNKNPKVLDDDKIHMICKFYEMYKAYDNNHNDKINTINNAIKFAGLENTESIFRLAERLYRKCTHRNICDNYNY